MSRSKRVWYLDLNKKIEPLVLPSGENFLEDVKLEFIFGHNIVSLTANEEDRITGSGSKVLNKGFLTYDTIARILYTLLALPF